MSPKDGVQYALTFAVREEISQAVNVLFLFEASTIDESLVYPIAMAPCSTFAYPRIKNSHRCFEQLLTDFPSVAPRSDL